jgi:hypothetical protein
MDENWGYPYFRKLPTDPRIGTSENVGLRSFQILPAYFCSFVELVKQWEHQECRN